MSIKDRTLNGMLWSFIGEFFDKGIAFVVGIVLARLLSPREYGLVAMVTIFSSLTIPFINSGFSQALMRKEKCTQIELSSVFYFNFLSGLLFYLILFFSAPYISRYFNEPELTKIARVVGLIIIIDAVSIIQITILNKNIDFKLQAKIIFIASILSSILGIIMAYYGFGVWSLVYKMMLFQIIRSFLLWSLNKWRPSKEFDISCLKELFGFSSKLLVSGIVDKIYYNLYNLVIAKYFSAITLGLYSRADMFKSMISSNLSEIVARVAFPILATLKSEPDKLENVYKKILSSTMLITMLSLFCMAAISESMIITLIGENWRDSILYLQLLCMVGIFYPGIAITRNLLYVFGLSGLVLKLEIMSKILAIPTVIIGIIWGIKLMILAMIFSGIIEYFVRAHFAGKLIKYSIWKQLLDLLPSFFISLTIGVVIYMIGSYLPMSPFFAFLIQIAASVIVVILAMEIIKLKEYTFLKDAVKVQIQGYFVRVNGNK